MKLYGYDWISLPLVYTQVFFTYCAEIELIVVIYS